MKKKHILPFSLYARFCLKLSLCDTRALPFCVDGMQVCLFFAGVGRKEGGSCFMGSDACPSIAFVSVPVSWCALQEFSLLFI